MLTVYWDSFTKKAWVQNFKTMIHILPAEMTLCLRWDTVHLILFLTSLDMNRLCSNWTSRCIVFWCIWSYLCCCKSLSASTLVNQLTHQSPWGRLDAGVCYQDVRPTRTIPAGSQNSSQVLKKNKLFFYFKIYIGLWRICQGTVAVTIDAKLVHRRELFHWPAQNLNLSLHSVTEVPQNYNLVNEEKIQCFTSFFLTQYEL